MERGLINYMFWTGGWDSTYMLIQELKKKKQIQPIYMVASDRRGRFKELNAMNKIVEKLKIRDFFGGDMLPILEINIDDIIISEKEKEAYEEILKTIRLGSQYKWLSSISKKYSSVSLGIEKPNGEFSGCVEAINTFGDMVYDDNGCGYIDEKKSSDSIKELFGSIKFPIITLTENDMLQNVKEWGVEDIMQEIWFCHEPIKGEACGFCRPCQQKMECNMQFLLPEKAQKRYAIDHNIKEKYGDFVSKIYRKIYRLLV